MKKFVEMFLISAMLFVGIMLITKVEAKAGNPIQCGDNVWYELNDNADSTYTLHIYGNGAMDSERFALSQKEDITKVVIDEGVTYICDEAFKECINLTEVSIPNSVISLGVGVFKECSSLTEISIPEGVTVINDGLLDGCIKLKNVTLPNGLVSIRYAAFNECKELESIEIPDSVTYIGSNAFSSCSSLREFSFPEGIKNLPSYVIEYGTFHGCESLQNITIPDNCTKIIGDAFRDCKNLKNIIIPDRVERIEYCAFQNCYGIESVTILANNVEIRGSAFKLCKKMSNITFVGAPNITASNAFNDCNAITSIVFKDATDADVDRIINTLKIINNRAYFGDNINAPKKDIAEIVVPDTIIDTIRIELAKPEYDLAAMSNLLKKESVYNAEHSQAPADLKVDTKDDTIASIGSPTDYSESAYAKKMNSLIKDIIAASAAAKKSTNGKKTVYLKDETVLSLLVMKTLRDNPNVILDMTYVYNGGSFHVVIPGGSSVALNESIPWYGPLWLNAYYGQGIQPNVKNNSNVYVVQTGDTLSKIAAMHSMSLAELVKRNPQIKNIDRISIGEKINL